LVPVRPTGFDARIPLPGDGSAEWTGNYVPIPKSINPTRGWLANWNNKPSADYPDIADQRTFGKMDRLMEIERRLSADGPFTFDDMKSIEEDIARSTAGGLGRTSRFLKPYLLAALDAVPPSQPLAPKARAILEAWDGSRLADPRSSTVEPGQVIFSRWLNLITTNTFADELETNVSSANANMLLHVLDAALGGGSPIPPSRDYFNGINPNVKMSATFDEALAGLNPDPSKWSTVPSTTVALRHTLYPKVPDAGTIFDVNRGTYAQIVVLSRPQITSVDILPLGQSGFIQRTPLGDALFDAHFADQLEFYKNFKYKDMHLYLNTQLQE
jgi:penicillin amidase